MDQGRPPGSTDDFGADVLDISTGIIAHFLSHGHVITSGGSGGSIREHRDITICSGSWVVVKICPGDGGNSGGSPVRLEEASPASQAHSAQLQFEPEEGTILM